MQLDNEIKMSRKIKTFLITSLFFSTFFDPYSLLAQIIDSSKNNSIPIRVESTKMKHLDFGFTVPESSMVTKVVYIENKGFTAFNNSGKELFIIFPFDNGPDYISEGMFRIIDGDMIGFASEMGEIMIEPKFSAVYPFHSKLAAFCDGCVTESDGEHKAWVNGNWGFINRKGEVVIPPKYNRIISDFEDGFAIVEREGVKLRINEKGEQIGMEESNNKKGISKPEESFPDYQPKTSPDTMLDYMPSLAPKWEIIPDAKIENLKLLVELFSKYNKEAAADPGKWEDGNIVLGAREREYRPSEAELLLCEVGERIQSLIESQPKESVKLELGVNEYLKFTFIHIDVMGSGRFYYVDKIEKCKIIF